MSVERLNNQGFTLLEMLLALSVFSMILIFCIHIIPLLRFYSYGDDMTDQMTWEIFLQQAKIELRKSEKIVLTGNTIKLMKDGQEIKYETYGDAIRRRVDNRGHEIILFQVQSFSVKETEGEIQISVELKNGTSFSTEIYLPISNIVTES